MLLMMQRKVMLDANDVDVDCEACVVVLMSLSQPSGAGGARRDRTKYQPASSRSISNNYHKLHNANNTIKYNRLTTRDFREG